MKKQIENQLPTSLRELALGALETCKDICKSIEKISGIHNWSNAISLQQCFFFTAKDYKDPCDKMYYSTKCMYDYSPKDFLYPWYQCIKWANTIFIHCWHVQFKCNETNILIMCKPNKTNKNKFFEREIAIRIIRNNSFAQPHFFFNLRKCTIVQWAILIW